VIHRSRRHPGALLAGVLAIAAADVTPVAAADNMAAARVAREADGSARSARPASAAGSTAERGREIFESRCVVCHGMGGRGDGRVARMYNPRPSDLTASTKSDTYKTMIIRKGGAYVGRSLIMPSWDGELTAQQISDVVAYLRVLSTAGR
jgi:mono/diheme cytochrome c family protein